MKRVRRTVLFALATYAAGLLTGALLVVVLVFGRGETVGAWIIGVGVRLTQSGTVPDWSTQIQPRPEPLAAPQPLPPATLARLTPQKGPRK